MQPKVRFIITLFICLFTSFGYGQKLHIAPFEGTVYKLPMQLKYWKFNEKYKDYPVLKTISWNKINVPSRDVEDGFPDIEHKGAFGIMFKTSFRASKTAMYKFTLSSDDGSILWIDGEEVVNNDTQGAMHMRTDTVSLLSFGDKWKYMKTVLLLLLSVVYLGIRYI